MMYVVTARSERLLQDLLGLAKELDAAVLARASAPARDEWSELLLRLPTEADLRRGVVALAEDELGRLLGKALRFRQILRAPEAPAVPVPRTSRERIPGPVSERDRA
jgi:hypothetical protein